MRRPRKGDDPRELGYGSVSLKVAQEIYDRGFRKGHPSLRPLREEMLRAQRYQPPTLAEQEREARARVRRWMRESRTARHPDYDRLEREFTARGSAVGLWDNPRRISKRLIREAYSLGVDAGTSAASWVDFDDPARALQMLDDGDPEIYDAVREPNLSGEYAGDPTPLSVAEELGIENPTPDELEAIASAWEEGVTDTFWPTVEGRLRRLVED